MLTIFQTRGVSIGLQKVIDLFETYGQHTNLQSRLAIRKGLKSLFWLSGQETVATSVASIGEFQFWHTKALQTATRKIHCFTEVCKTQ